MGNTEGGNWDLRLAETDNSHTKQPQNTGTSTVQLSFKIVTDVLTQCLKNQP